MTQKIVLICDQCWKSEEDPESVWYSLEKLDPQGLRLYEKIGKVSFEVKHLVNRKEVNFCCKDCIRKRLIIQMDLFVEELSPIQERDKEITVF